jgi:leader peptidase (prepilin peptidase)/N-methyltransferase
MPSIGWKRSLLGIAIGGGALFLTGEVYKWVRGREGVGMGDVWLLGMTGAFLGWIGVLFTLFFGSILGTVGGLLVGLSGVALPAPIGEPQAAVAAAPDESLLRTTVPFGPFLAMAAGCFALFQPQLVHWYLSR